jgi:hypothetical protein
MMPDSVLVPLVAPLAYTIKAIPDNIAKINTVESIRSLTFLSSQITSFFFSNQSKYRGAIKGFFRIRPNFFLNPG